MVYFRMHGIFYKSIDTGHGFFNCMTRRQNITQCTNICRSVHRNFEYWAIKLEETARSILKSKLTIKLQPRVVFASDIEKTSNKLSDNATYSKSEILGFQGN